MVRRHLRPLAAAVLAAAAPLLGGASAHVYLHVPPARTGDCTLNGVVMGDTICRDADPADDEQCLSDLLAYSHLFHVHPAYSRNACGGSTSVGGSDGGSQGLLQNCGDMSTDPSLFDMTMKGPENVTSFAAGSEVELSVRGFFHQGVMRMALCFLNDADCSSPQHFDRYILGFHFTEGTSGPESAPDGIYSVELPFKVRMPRRTGRAVLQWLVHAEDVRSYVSCSSVEITDEETSVGNDPPENTFDHDGWSCNGHPLCNCTTSAVPSFGSVGLGVTCPQGTAPSVFKNKSSGTDIVEQYKEQLGVDAFCGNCITNGCPSTCGGKYEGFYQGPSCSNTPTIAGCGAAHSSSLPRYVECTEATCVASGWAPSPAPPTPSPPPANAGVSEVELDTKFARMRVTHRQCRWIAQFKYKRRRSICKRASARAKCPASCSEQGCVRSADGSLSPGCESEWRLKYVHKKQLKVETCRWLRDSRKRSSICRKVADASASCPTVCEDTFVRSIPAGRKRAHRSRPN